MSKQEEMADIFNSYEWLIRERLIKIDQLARSMFAEMATFGIPHQVAREYSQKRFMELVESVAREGDGKSVKNYRLLGHKSKHKRLDQDLRTEGC